MTSALRRCLLSAAMIPIGVGALAQESGFALEVSPPADTWLGLRVGVAVYGETVEPAAGYVRGCPGFVSEERAAVQIDVTEQMEVLTLTAADNALQGMVLGTPDGFYRCVTRSADGLVAARLDQATPGRYRVWLAGPEASAIAARLIVADRPVSRIELMGLEVDAMGPPRAGAHVFTGETPRQTLALAATLFPESTMNPLDPANYCAGHSRFDAPDAVLTLDAAQRGLSIFARSERDLTIAVRAPDGTILCNDDSYGLDPSVTFDSAAAGDYLIFVGAYSQGGTGNYDLFANLGAPSWSGLPFEVGGPPRAGSFTLDTASLSQSRILARVPVVSREPMSNLPITGYCPGFTGTDAPDAIITVTEGQPVLNIFAASSADLVLAVRDPAGNWLCNDDAYRLNPMISFADAMEGEYLAYVGTFGQGVTGTYALGATTGEPDWEGALAGTGGSGGMPNAAAAPLVGTLDFGPATRIDPRVIFDITPSTTDARGLGEGCVGFITPEAPDVVIRALPELPQLMVYAVSDADGVLVVVGPDGRIHCNDDFEGLNPGVMIPNPQAGDYAVFAGTYGGNGGMATLGVTIASPQWVVDREH